jgi:hypothetical protein
MPLISSLAAPGSHNRLACYATRLVGLLIYLVHDDEHLTADSNGLHYDPTKFGRLSLHPRATSYHSDIFPAHREALQEPVLHRHGYATMIDAGTLRRHQLGPLLQELPLVPHPLPT